MELFKKIILNDILWIKKFTGTYTLKAEQSQLEISGRTLPRTHENKMRTRHIENRPTNPPYGRQEDTTLGELLSVC